MRFLASHDGLTGLMNRAEIVETLRCELERSCRDKRPLTVAMADIDHFKMVNDELGHLAGDEVLAEVGRLLRSELRTYDAVGRYGGEEFLVLMPGADTVTALVRADQIRSAVSSKPIRTSKESRIITLSMGVAVIDGTKEVSVHSVLHQADLGLYKAKRNGRNRVEQVDETETVPSQVRGIEAELLDHGCGFIPLHDRVV
jgi:diguanylate cyclase (GGDEF)-like protein